MSAMSPFGRPTSDSGVKPLREGVVLVCVCAYTILVIGLSPRSTLPYHGGSLPPV